MNNNTVYEWLLQTTFTASARQNSLGRIAPHLYGLVMDGDQVLDLCCGSGFASFWLEERGAKVTAVDVAPYMIALAREEAARRGSSVHFVEANVLSRDLGESRYDLICCFGNSISDFPFSDFADLGRKIAVALKPGGCFVLDYHDGRYEFLQGSTPREGVYQEAPERITFRYKEYLPEVGAYVHTIRNEARGEEYERKAYLYSVPMVRLALPERLLRRRHVVLSANHFLDVFVRPSMTALLLD